MRGKPQNLGGRFQQLVRGKPVWLEKTQFFFRSELERTAWNGNKKVQRVQKQDAQHAPERAQKKGGDATLQNNIMWAWHSEENKTAGAGSLMKELHSSLRIRAPRQGGDVFSTFGLELVFGSDWYLFTPPIKARAGGSPTQRKPTSSWRTTRLGDLGDGPYGEDHDFEDVFRGDRKRNSPPPPHSRASRLQETLIAKLHQAGPPPPPYQYGKILPVSSKKLKSKDI